jgi:hypothetical protein
MCIESNHFSPYVYKKEYKSYNPIIEYVKLAAPEDDPLGSKRVV